MNIKYVLLAFIGLLSFSDISFGQSDGCSAATTLSITANCSSPTAGTTIGATQTIPGCVGTADDDVWYKFVATATSHQIDVTGAGAFDAVVQLFSGGCSALVSLNCQDQTFGGGTETIYATGLTIGNTYTIRVYDYYTGSPGNFTICVTAGPTAPTNDFCSNAIALPVNTSCSYTSGTSLGATQTLAGCAGTADDDVWFSFVATNSVQTITVDPSTTMDPVVQLLDGVCVTFNSLYCVDNGFTDGNEVINAVGLTPGNTYYIRVYDYYNGNGGDSFNICVTGTATSAPTNDDPCNAIALPPVTSACEYLDFTTTGATASLGAPTPSSCVGGSLPQEGGFSASTADVWFTITVPATGVIEVMPDPASGLNDMTFALYSGTCGSLTQISCSDDNNYPNPSGSPTPNDWKPKIYETGLTPNDVLFLRAWGYGTAQGDFGICVNSPTNDECVNALYICDINGYSASTSSSFTPDRPDNMYANNELADGTPQVDGINTGGPFGGTTYDVEINNNSWIRFTASATTATLNVDVYDCWKDPFPAGGIQMEVFEGTNCTNFVSVSNFEENSTGFVITATGLTIGQDYYLMVDGYAGDICSYTITANTGVQFPEITAAPETICVNASTTLTAPNGATSYAWYPGGETTQSISVSPSTTTTYYCIVEGVCGYKQTLTKTITVNQNPTMTSSASPAAICSGDAVGLSLISDLSSTYSWIATSNTNVGGETTSAQSSNPINDVLTNTTTVSQNVTYTVTPTSTFGCVGDPQIVTITVNPSPSMTSTTSQTICSGGTVNIPLTSNVGASYSWIAANNANTTGESTSTQTTSTINNTITNSTSSSQNVVYTVTPTSTIGSCTGSGQTVTVTVNPAPSMTSANSQTICSGNAASVSLTSNIASSYAWSAASNGNITGESTSTQSTSTINDVLTNTTSSSQNVIYTVTPTSTVGSCLGSGQTVTVTVNPPPTMTSTNTGTICSGNSVGLSLTSNIASTYSWVATDNANTTGESTSAQTGSTINDVITNSTTSAQNVSYTVTPTSSAGSCLGIGQSVTITVNPTPSMTSSNTGTICSGGTINIPLTSDIASNYSWVATNNINTTGESTSTQTTSTINNTITNATSASQNVIYTVTPTSTAGSCGGSGQTVTVTVNPAPTMTSPASQSICSGNSVNIPLTSDIASSYSWSAASNGNVTGESTTFQSTSTINDGLTNITSGVETVTYTVTPTSISQSCIGTDQTVTVTVNPSPTMTSASSQTICSGSNVNIPLTSDIASSYSWSATSNVNVTGESTSAQSSSTINDGLTNTTASAENVIYTVTPTSISGSCVGSGQTVTVTVNPLDDPSFAYSPTTFCLTGSDPTPSSVTTPGGNYTATGGLVINGTSGLIDLSASGVNSYDITYTTNGTCPDASTITINITNAPDATFSYSSASFCQTGTATVSHPVGSSDGDYTFTPSGLTINASTGEIDLANSSANTYTITNDIVAAGGCAAATANTVVTINPNPTMTSSTTQAICSGNNVNIPLTSDIASNYSWIGTSNANVGGESTSAQSTSTINDALTNVTSTSEDVIYTVTPTSIVGSCVGADQTVTITVNPEPVMTNSSTQTICSGDNVNIPLTSSIASSYSWVATENVNVTGESLSAQTSTTITDGLTNTTSGVETVTYTVTPTAITGSCLGSNQTITVTVNPAPTMTNANTATVCSETALSISLTSDIAANYLWVANDNSNTSGESVTAQTGSTINDIIFNNTSATENVTYTVTPTSTAGTCAGADQTITVTINPLDDASFNYTGGTFCATGTDPTPVITGLTGGTFTIDNGGTINNLDGTIDLAISGINSYIVTYTTAGTCPNSSTTPITITSAPDATFDYGGINSYCQIGTAAVVHPLGASDGVYTFTPSSGLSINGSTGEVDLVNSAPNTYTITNTIDLPGCALAVDDEIITILPPDNDGFTYSSTTYCSSDLDQLPTIDAPGGTFTATGGLLFTDANPTSNTGEIDITNTPLGTFDITYTTNGSCINDSTFTVTISGQLDATITSIGTTTFCETDAAVFFTSADAGGTWSGNGIDPSTGEFTPQNANIGSQWIYYEITGACGDIDSVELTINITPNVSVLGDTICDGTLPTLVATGNGGVINWYSDAGLSNLVAGDTNMYSPSVSNGIYTYYVQETLNGCSGSIDSANANVFNLSASFTASPTEGNIPLIVDFTNTSTVVDTLNDQFIWDFGNGEFSTEFEPSSIYDEDGTFTALLTVINAENMCTDTFSVEINANGEMWIEIPNIFTPNGDMENDIFHVRSENVIDVNATIFDRWGMEIYNWNGIYAGWDGRTKAGINASEGTYYYFIEATDFKGEIHKYNGPFNLNR